MVKRLKLKRREFKGLIPTLVKGILEKLVGKEGFASFILNNVKELKVIKIVKQIKFEGVLGELKGKYIS